MLAEVRARLPEDDLGRAVAAAALAQVAPDRAAEARDDLDRCLLSDFEEVIRVMCLEGLDRAGGARPETLVALLASPVPYFRERAARDLAEAPAAMAREPLLARLADADVGVRSAAGGSLLKAVPDPPAAALPALLEGTCRGEGWHVADVLGELAPELARQAEEPLVAELRGVEPHCRTWAAIALARIDPVRAYAALGLIRAALAEADWHLRNAAAWSLLAMGPAALPALPDLRRAAATDPGLAFHVAQLGQPMVEVQGIPFPELRLALIAPVDGAGGPVAGVVLRDGRLAWVVAGDRILGGEVERVEPYAVVVRGERVREDFSVEPYRGRVELFPDGPPPPAELTGEFTGDPMSVHYDGDLHELVLAVAELSGLNVIIETAAPAPVRLRAKDLAWDGVVSRAVADAGLALAVEGRFARIGKAGRMMAVRLPSAPSGEPIRLNLRRVEVADLLGAFARLGGIEVPPPPAAREQLAIVTDEVPWDEVLAYVAAAQGWTWQLDGKRLLLTAGGR